MIIWFAYLQENIQVVDQLTDNTFFIADAQFNAKERLNPESMAIRG